MRLRLGISLYFYDKYAKKGRQKEISGMENAFPFCRLIILNAQDVVW
ncbi:MAG: hypothetical protein ACP5DZ_07280 [Bacteroidales bacterium]